MSSDTRSPIRRPSRPATGVVSCSLSPRQRAGVRADDREGRHPSLSLRRRTARASAFPALGWAAPPGGGRRELPRRLRTAFSLIEIMVVVVIIGLLAGAVAIKVGDYMQAARVNRARSDLVAIENAIEFYKLQRGQYPGGEEGLSKLSIKTRIDPWGQPYRYNLPPVVGTDVPFEVYTLGEDQREGGEGPDADLYSWQVGQPDAKE